MAYRGDETDPLEIIIAQRRLMRRMVLVGLLLTVLPVSRLHPVKLLMSLVRPARPAAAGPAKLNAAQVMELLRATPASGAPRAHHCTPAHNGWDYICWYRPDPTSMLLHIGVRVSSTGIVQASLPYPSGRAIPAPAPIAGAS